jgi:hypothetical protein
MLVAGTLGLWLILFEAMEPPATFSCEGEPTPEARDARDRYLPGAILVAAAAGVALATLAISWSRALAMKRGGPWRPRPRSVVLAGLLISAWVILIGRALSSERTGGSLFLGSLGGAASLAVLAVLALLLLGQLTIVRPSSPDWDKKNDWLTKTAAWVLLLGLYPATLVFMATAGTDTTIWC